VDKIDIIEMARSSGMAVILDGRIGREEYQSVCGSLLVLQRFAEAVTHCVATRNQNHKRGRKISRRAPMPAIRPPL
jgi:hypothetical protein